MFKNASFFEVTLFAVITTLSLGLYAYVKLGVGDIHRTQEILNSGVQSYSIENDRFERDHRKPDIFQSDWKNSSDKDQR